MSVKHADDLTARVADLEAQLLAQAAALNSAVARLQDELAAARLENEALREQTYWLDRYGVDLNAAMRRRAVVRARVLLGKLRRVVRP
jgi:hypothetical protein